MLVDDGVIARDGSTYELTIDAEAVEVPPTIQSLLAARVERLPAEERRVVELASVVGSEFARGALAGLAPDVDRRASTPASSTCAARSSSSPPATTGATSQFCGSTMS